MGGCSIGNSTLGVPLVRRPHRSQIRSFHVQQSEAYFKLLTVLFVSWMQWALEISDNPGVLEPKPAFKVFKFLTFLLEE